MADEQGKISGVVVRSLMKIPDERGTIMHGVTRKNLLNPFGEVYFKKLYYGVVNGWHIHDSLVLNYVCIFGMIKIVLYDMREHSPTKGIFDEFYIGDDNYCLVHIPAGIANGSKGLGSPYSIMVNVASEPHDPKIKYERIDPHSGIIPYDWVRQDY